MSPAVPPRPLSAHTSGQGRLTQRDHTGSSLRPSGLGTSSRNPSLPASLPTSCPAAREEASVAALPWRGRRGFSRVGLGPGPGGEARGRGGPVSGAGLPQIKCFSSPLSASITDFSSSSELRKGRACLTPPQTSGRTSSSGDPGGGRGAGGAPHSRPQGPIGRMDQSPGPPLSTPQALPLPHLHPPQNKVGVRREPLPEGARAPWGAVEPWQLCPPSGWETRHPWGV